MVLGNGSDLLDCVESLLTGGAGADAMAFIRRTRAWLAEGAPGRRSINHLATTAGERRRFNAALRAGGPEIEWALLRAQRELRDEPLAVRIGLIEVGKQAKETDDVWNLQLPRQRGSDRLRENRLLLAVTKVLGDPVLPGATAIIPPGTRADEAVRQLLRRIRRADSRAEIVDVDFDTFDEQLTQALKAPPQPPFCLRVPELSEPGTTVALVLAPRPAVLETPVQADGDVPDLHGVRIGRRLRWSGTFVVPLDLGDPHGGLTTTSVRVSVSDELTVRARRPFRARVARIAPDPARPADGLPLPTTLVAVLGETDAARIAQLAVRTLSFTDAHPEVRRFLAARHTARVFRGEEHSRAALHADRGIAAAALAAHLLDLREPGELGATVIAGT